MNSVVYFLFLQLSSQLHHASIYVVFLYLFCILAFDILCETKSNADELKFLLEQQSYRTSSTVKY